MTNNMENSTKQQIVEQLTKYVAKIGSANKASKALGVSGATVSNMINGKWESISDDIFRSVEKQTKEDKTGWVTVQTKEYKLLSNILNDAKENANVYGICADPGYGKTYVTRLFTEQQNVFMVCCNEYYNRKTFLADLLNGMGKDSGGFTVAEMMFSVTTQINKLENPVIVLDEADKLSDQVLYFFISLYNILQDKCGIILIATDHLEKRILKGVSNNKKGYKEIYSRLGRKFIHMPKMSKQSVLAIINANGITDDESVAAIYNDSENDLRRVKRLVHAKKLQGAA